MRAGRRWSQRCRWTRACRRRSLHSRGVAPAACPARPGCRDGRCRCILGCRRSSAKPRRRGGARRRLHRRRSRWVDPALPVLLPDPPLRCALCFFPFRAATSHALMGASSPEVDDGRGGLALPDPPLRRAFLFFLFRAAMSHALTGASSLEVDDGCYSLHCGLLPD